MLPFTIYQGLTIETVSCKSFVSKLPFRQTPCLMGSKERTSRWHGIVMCAIGRGFFLFLSLSRLSLPCGIGHLVINSNVYLRYRTVKIIVQSTRGQADFLCRAAILCPTRLEVFMKTRSFPENSKYRLSTVGKV